MKTSILLIILLWISPLAHTQSIDPVLTGDMVSDFPLINGKTKNADSKDLCTIDAHIDQYSEQRVRVHAYYSGDVLYDPRCPIPMAYVVLKPDTKGKSLRKFEKKLHGPAIVVVEGIVHGPKPYPIDPKFPEAIKNALKNQVIGYGHMGNCKMEIEVEKILDLKGLDDRKSK